MPLSARQQRTLEMVAKKIAAQRAKLLEDEAKVLAALATFTDLRDGIEQTARKEVGQSRERLRESFDRWRTRLAEAAGQYNEIASEAIPDEDQPVLVDNVDELAEPLDDESFGYVLDEFGGEDAKDAHLIDPDYVPTRKHLTDAIKSVKGGFDESMREAKKDPDAFLDDLADPSELLGEEDFDAWQAAREEEEAALEEEG